MTAIKKINFLLLAVMALAIFAGSIRAMDDPDIWFQLLAGKYALARGSVPHTDFFLYAGGGQEQMFGGWGFGAIYQLAISAFGLAATSYLNAAIWTASLLFAIRAAALRSGKPLAEMLPIQAMAFALTVLAIEICVTPRTGMRAESTLFLAWTGAAWLFESCRAKGRFAPFLVGLPLIAWAEAWLHTGGFVLLALAPICFAQLPVEQMRRRAVWGPWLASFAALLVLPILNPNGFDQVYIQLKSVMSLFAAGVSGGPQFQNVEYLPIWDPRMGALIPNFAVMGLLCAVAFSRRVTKGVLVENAAIAAFAVLACLHTRGIGMATLLAMVPTLAAALRASPDKIRLSPKLAVGLALVFAAGPFAVGYSSGRLRTQGDGNNLGEAVSIIKQVRPNGANIFSVESGPQLAYSLGDERYLIASTGHLIRPNAAVSEHIAGVVNANGDWHGELMRHKVEFACVPLYLSLPKAGIFYWLPSMLATRSDWKFYPISGPCSLFLRLPEAQRLTDDQVDEQTLLYLQNLKLLASLGAHGSSPDKVAEELVERSTRNIESVKKRRAERAKAAGPAPSPGVDNLPAASFAPTAKSLNKGPRSPNAPVVPSP